MKIIQSSLLLVVLLAANPAPVVATEFIAGDKSLETAICVAAVNNNVYKYKSSVGKISNFQPLPNHNQKIVANRLKCNDQNIASFARYYGATETAKYISRFLIRRVQVSRDVAATAYDENAIEKPESVIVIAGSL